MNAVGSAQSKTRTIAAGEFKAKCLQLMDEVNEKGLILIVTKRGKAVARVGPPSAEEQPFQSVLGRTPEVKILGDIMSPIDWPDPHGDWEPLSKSANTRKKRK